MKRLTFILAIMVLMVANVDAQKSKRTSALNYLRKGKLDKAKEYIDIAAKHPKTGIDPKTWDYRGNIYVTILTDSSGKYDALKKDAVEEAIKSYQNVLKYDEKGILSIEAKKKILALTDFVFNDATTTLKKAYAEKDEAKRQELFEKSVGLLKKSFDLYKSGGRTDTTSLYYMAMANEQAKKIDEAKKLYNQLIEMNYNQPDIYIAMGNLYAAEGNLDESMKYFNMGSKRYPKNLNIVLNASNVYLKSDNPKKAIEILEKAAELDPTNPTVFSAIGSKYEDMVEKAKTEEEKAELRKKAEDAFTKAIELKPDYFDPNYNMGALYVNHAVEVNKQMEGLPLDQQKKYDELKAKADGLLEKALPYMEKAHEINPEDRAVLNSLKEIYARLKKYEKLKEINKALQK